MKTAMKPSRTIPAISTAIQISSPWATEISPTPTAIMMPAGISTILRSGRRSEPRAIGITQIRLMV